MIKSVFPRCVTPLLLAMALASPAAVRADAPAGGNLLGQKGLLRMVSASNHPAGVITLGTDLQIYSARNLLSEGQDHARMENTLSISWTPLRFLEAALALHVISDSSSGKADELQVAVGDPQISLKGSYEILDGLTLGALVDLRFPSGAGYFEAALSSTNALLAVVASYSLGDRLPLAIHLNVGFLIDGSENMFDDLSRLTTSQLYAAQISSFNRVVTRLGVEYLTKYVGPFVELSLEPYVGGGAPGFTGSPGRVSFGARVWPTKSKSLQVLAAMDVGITGVGYGSRPPLPAGKFSVVLPRWNLLFRLSYRFDPFEEPAPKVVAERPKKECPPPPQKPGVVIGEVLDARTGKPVWNAMIRVEGQEASSQAVSPQDGGFRTFGIPAGDQVLFVAADGYDAARSELKVPAGGQVKVVVKLKTRAAVPPGTLRGSIKDTRGRKVKGATILIPALDKTIQVPGSGSFSLTLKPGEYKVIISAPRFRTQRKSIRIQEGDTVILNVELFR